MKPTDLIYNEVYKGCLNVKCDERLARETAIMTIQKYKNNQFTKVSKLIQQSITDAKKLVFKRKNSR